MIQESDNLQNADGNENKNEANKALQEQVSETKEESSTETIQEVVSEEKTVIETSNAEEVQQVVEETAETEVQAVEENIAQSEEPSDTVEEVVEEENQEVQEENTVVETETSITEETVVQVEESSEEPVNVKEESTEAEAQETSEEESSEEKEKEIPFKNYKELNEDVLIGEAEKLLKQYPVHKIRKHLFEIRSAISQKFNEQEKAAKEKFVAEGGNAIDFYFDNPKKQKFYKTYNDFKKQLDAYHKNQEKEEQENLKKRLDLIEQLKALYTEPSSSNTELFQKFRVLKTSWSNAGRIPRAQSRDVFRTYYHHMDNFYEYLNLNKELREMDLQHNLEVRETIIKRAEQLVNEPNIQKVLNELQYLHRMWKDEAVPVAEEHREPTWERFKELTSKIHERKEEFHANIKEEQEKNLALKQEVIQKIVSLTVADGENLSHGEWQKRIREFEGLRKEFLGIGRVPREVNNQMWDTFKEKSRAFNRQKNNFYKTLKKDQNVNLEKKLALLEIAKQHQDSTDWETSVREVKRIQREWKTIGHVPRSQSDKIWKEFKDACNAFFDNYKARNSRQDESFHRNYEQKLAILEEVEKFEIKDEQEALNSINEFNIRWNSIGKIPRSKMSINDTYQDKISELLTKLNLNEQEIQEFKVEAVIAQIVETRDERLLDQQIYKTRRQLDELEKEYKQLETNVEFFSNADADNPLLKDVYRQIREKKDKITETEILLRKLSSIDFEEEDEQEFDEPETESEETDSEE